MFPVFILPNKIFSMSYIIENYSSILDILLSSVTPEIVDFLSASDIEILDIPAAFGVLSFTVSKVKGVRRNFIA